VCCLRMNVPSVIRCRINTADGIECACVYVRERKLAEFASIRQRLHRESISWGKRVGLKVRPAPYHLERAPPRQRKFVLQAAAEVERLRTEWLWEVLGREWAASDHPEWRVVIDESQLAAARRAKEAVLRETAGRN
jgi:hypothetical protein